MVESAVRVALLARPGNARDQLRKALTELGASLVAEGDPAELDPAAVSALSPSMVLVSLEPAIEPALDRFDALLATPGVEVMYDDAETTRELDGWDLNRWARHLAAKLMGSDVLPPAPGGADLVPEFDMSPLPGLPPTPAQLMDDEKLEDYAQDAPDLADWVPTNPSLTDAEVAPENETHTHTEALPDDEEISLDLDIGDIESALSNMDAQASVEAVAPAAAEEAAPLEMATSDEDFTFEFDTDSADALASLPTDEFIEAAPPAKSAFDDGDEAPLLADVDLESSGPVRFSTFEEDHSTIAVGGMDDDVAALAAQLEAFEKTDTRQEVRDPDFLLAQDNDPPAKSPAPSSGARPAERAPPNAAAMASSMDFSKLSLTDMEDEAAHAPPPPVAAKEAAAESSSLASLSLAPIDDEAGYQEFVRGAVVIIAGLGGPDAVRQLLASLPEKMPVPVLLYQHLEVGKHERLAEQLGKISKLPVVLAEEGQIALPGRISVLPAGLTAISEHSALRFATGSLAELISALTPADSAVVMLSGADAGLVPGVMKLLAAGGIAMAQDPDSCFDPAAAHIMVRQGAPTFPALGLAQKIAARWP